MSNIREIRGARNTDNVDSLVELVDTMSKNKEIKALGVCVIRTDGSTYTDWACDSAMHSFFMAGVAQALAFDIHNKSYDD